MRKHHSALGGVALALALTLTGCSDDGNDPEAEDTPTDHADLRADQPVADSEDARGEGGGPTARRTSTCATTRSAPPRSTSSDSTRSPPGRSF